MKATMKDITTMYIKLLKAINTNTDECCDIEHAIVNIIEERLKFYGIEKYDYNKTGGTTTEAFEYYVEQMVKKYYDVPNFFETEYWKQIGKYIPHDMKYQIKIKEILHKMENKEKIIKFLDWYKQISSGITYYFDYKIIEQNEIQKVMMEYDYEELRIEIQNFDHDFDNPIICWLQEIDTPTLIIMDWVCLRDEMKDWIIYEGEKETFIEKFGTPTLEEYINEKYGDYGKDVCMALEHEVNEFYNIYKDDIVEEDGDLWSKSERLMLQDAIWGHAPLFSSTQIARLVEKIYNKELKL